VSGDGPVPRRLVALAATVTGMFVVAGFAAMWLLSPRVPYADTWRFLDRFLSVSFPANVLAADNGHREVFPNLVRVAELHWCDANQALQITGGMLLAALFGLLAWRSIRALAWAPRAAATVTIAAGVFWLGNGRKLAHGSESIHLFAVLCCLAGGLLALTRAAAGARATVLAALLALAATFCFGSGVACFPAFVVVALLQRRPVRDLLPFAVAGTLALAALLLGGDGGVPASWSLPRTAELALRLLGAPSTWAFSPLLDPEHAARLPGALLAGAAGLVAGPAHDAFGPALAARWPALAFGIAGAAWLLAATWRCARRTCAREALLGLGFAWFAVACTAMVAALRLDYFALHPEQVTTQRYLPWSMLLWTGLLLQRAATVERPRAALLSALVFAALLLPSSVWTARYAWKQRATAELTAVGAAVGMLGTDFPLEETIESELRHVLPALREQRTAMFAWPETAWLGRALPPGRAPLAVRDVVVEPRPNRFGPPGCAVTLLADDPGGDHLLLVDAAGVARGIVARLPFEPHWRGWMLGTPDAATLRVVTAP
jgi:hypothetical protein